MGDSVEEIKGRVPHVAIVEVYKPFIDHSDDAFWYSRVTASDLEYYSLKFKPEFWRGTLVVGLNKNSRLLEFVSIRVIKELKATSLQLVEAILGDRYAITASRGDEMSFDVFLSPK